MSNKLDRFDKNPFFFIFEKQSEITMTTNEQTVAAFLTMMSSRQSAAELDAFYHPQIEQIEYPNLITKNTAVRNLTDLKDGSEHGRQLLSAEHYEIKNLYCSGDAVILEAVWKGTLAIPLGTLQAGDVMTAHFAQFFEFKDGKILKQRNYDCFDPLDK